MRNAFRGFAFGVLAVVSLLMVVAVSAQTYTFHILAGLPTNTAEKDATGTDAGFSVPSDVAVDSAGNLYVCDYFGQTVRKITPDGVVTTLAGLPGVLGTVDGTGTQGRFKYPYGIAVEGNGANMYVADSNNQAIRKVTSAGVVSTFAGLIGAIGNVNATGTDARFAYPFGVRIDSSNNLYVGDTNNHEIRMITPGAVVTTLAGTGSQGSTDTTGTLASFRYPDGAAPDAHGNVFVCDTDNYVIRKITPGAFVSTIAGSAGNAAIVDGVGSAARFTGPYTSAVDPVNGNLFIVDRYAALVRKLAPSGLVTTIAGVVNTTGSTDGRGTVATFNNPTGIAIDSNHRLYIADSSNDVIRVGIPMQRGDFQGDIKSDLFWRNASTGADSAWLMNGTGVAVNAAMPTVSDPNFKIVGIGDFQGDGKTDLLWRNSVTGANVMWLMDGTSVAVSAMLPTVADPNWTVAGVGDFQGDGNSDILWRNVVTGDNSMWLMDGTSVAVSASLPNVASNFSVAGIGDFQADGRDDILWRNSSTGADVMWLMNGPVVALSALLPTVSGSWTIAGVGDFQGDGKADILWRNTATGDNAMWLMDGPSLAVAASITAVPDTNWNVVRVGDFQGDGKADIVWRNSATGSNSIWLMNGTSIAVSAALPVVPDVNWKVGGPQ